MWLSLWSREEEHTILFFFGGDSIPNAMQMESSGDLIFKFNNRLGVLIN